MTLESLVASVLKEAPNYRLRNARIVEVILVETSEGEGIENDRSRIVTSYYDKTGRLLFRHDPCPEGSE